MKVLFVCTGNTCRSPMAEGILKHIIKEKGLNMEVYSAGVAVYQGDRASRNSIKAMNNIGIDISEHQAIQISHELIEDADLILTMSNSHKDFILSSFESSKDKTFTLLEYAYKTDKNVADPFGGNLAMYEKTRDEIYEAIENIVNSE